MNPWIIVADVISIASLIFALFALWVRVKTYRMLRESRAREAELERRLRGEL